MKEERKPFSRRHETFVFLSLLPNIRLLPFQRLFSIPFAAAASHGAKACACFPLLFCCKSSSSFSSCCSISNSLFIWSVFGIWVLCNFYGFFFGEGPLYNRAHFLFFTRKRQRLSNNLSISSISLLPFLSFSRYSLMNCFIICSQNTFARHPEAPRITTAPKPCRECGELSLRFYLEHLHQLGVYLARSWAWCQDCVFCPAAEFGENDFIALHVQAAIHSVAPFQFTSLSTPSLVGLATIPCTLPLYFA